MGASTAVADSIWQRRDPEHAYLFIDSQARRVGDLLTVIISQNTDVQNRDDRELNKTASASEAFSLAGQAGGGFSQQSSSAALDFSNEADRSFQGGAAYSSERTFQDRFTVSVVDILPNGNLVVSG
ncbi:MAG: flagellar basal body L-ring protein FlgH, partial [Planctomycetaceae bacterium]|nr:flagellar basal body L-ring protein FlgH [Planctomycetaceae bacterium]